MFSTEYSAPIFTELAVPKSVSNNSLHIMKAFKDMIFISEVLLQSKIAQTAFEGLQAAHENFDPLEVWCFVQSILVSTGKTSKILWPGKDRLRGKRLREML